MIKWDRERTWTLWASEPRTSPHELAPNRRFRYSLWLFWQLNWGIELVYGTDCDFHGKGDWRPSFFDGFGLQLSRHMVWGSSHTWYDGAHCMWGLGPFHVYWHNHNCKKCLGENE